jgi:hypothetical protein
MTLALSNETLPALAQQINVIFSAIDTLTLDRRIEAGKLLKSARDQIPESKAFFEWCKINIKRSKSDIYAFIALASTPDPVKSREAEKARNRDKQQTPQARKRRKISVNSQTAPVAGSAIPTPNGGIAISNQNQYLTRAQYAIDYAGFVKTDQVVSYSELFDAAKKVLKAWNETAAFLEGKSNG